MFVATNRLYVPKEQRAAFKEQFIANMRRYLPGVPGLRRSTLLEPTEEGQPYLSINEFDSEEDFRAWVASRSFREAHARDQGVARYITGNSAESFRPAEDLLIM